MSSRCSSRADNSCKIFFFYIINYFILSAFRSKKRMSFCNYNIFHSLGIFYEFIAVNFTPYINPSLTSIVSNPMHTFFFHFTFHINLFIFNFDFSKFSLFRLIDSINSYCSYLLILFKFFNIVLY